LDEIGGRKLIGRLSNLDLIEAEALQIFREVEGDAKNSVLMFSAGKDSAVLLHLALKAFSPLKLPFPILHVDTTWKFSEMIAYRDKAVAGFDLDLLVFKNDEAIEEGVTPFSSDAGYYTSRLKTEPLKKALSTNGFDVVYGGARRDEEASRSKERICSWRSQKHVWEPRSQRPEPWNIFNTRKNEGESFRVFPLSNWTEMDIWAYIKQENISLPDLYFAKPRETVIRDGQIIVVDDDRMPLKDGENIEVKTVRFRSLGCYPLTAAHLSDATTIDGILLELDEGNISERHGRVIDKDQTSNMEAKKREGYF
jgi:sulfate adenylyltransferase subunit 2